MIADRNQLPLLSRLLSEMQMVCFLDGFQLSVLTGTGTGAARVTVAWNGCMFSLWPCL